MNTNQNDQELLLQLRGLRRGTMPEHDLWPGIAARIAQHERSPGNARNVVPLRRRSARLAPFALAASLVLAVGVAWQQSPDFGVRQVDPTGRLIHREADALTREYDAALRELQAAGTPYAPAGNALRQLDQSAAQIRTALTRDPDARFLLDQLRRTYEKRLELTQRATLS